LSDLTTNPLPDAQADAQTNRHPQWRRTSWVKGQSGNPLGHKLTKQRQRERLDRRDEIERAIKREFGGRFTSLQNILVRQAADQMWRAEMATSDNGSTRSLHAALRLITDLQRARAARQGAKKAGLTEFDRYLLKGAPK
jgi:hypothetical protein